MADYRLIHLQNTIDEKFKLIGNWIDHLFGKEKEEEIKPYFHCRKRKRSLSFSPNKHTGSDEPQTKPQNANISIVIQNSTIISNKQAFRTINRNGQQKA